MKSCQITITKTDDHERVLVERRNVAGTAITSSYRVDDDIAAVLHAVEHELREVFKVPREPTAVSHERTAATGPTAVSHERTAATPKGA